MIIKTTFKDNDFSGVLENYWSKFWFCNYYRAIRKIEDAREFRDRNVEAEDLLNKAFYKESEMTPKDIRLFASIIKESILAYIGEFYNEHYDYLKENLVVGIKSTLKDRDENGEVVYYLLKSKKAITM